MYQIWWLKIQSRTPGRTTLSLSFTLGAASSFLINVESVGVLLGRELQCTRRRKKNKRGGFGVGVVFFHVSRAGLVCAGPRKTRASLWSQDEPVSGTQDDLVCCVCEGCLGIWSIADGLGRGSVSGWGGQVKCVEFPLFLNECALTRLSSAWVARGLAGV